jgi:hypothetical protein
MGTELEETLEEFANRTYRESFELNLAGTKIEKYIKIGAKWQQEQDVKFCIKYIKSERDFQIPRMKKLGINTNGQIFEQMVSSLIHLAERRHSDEDLKQAFLDGLFDMSAGTVDEVISEWFKNFKKNKMTAIEWLIENSHIVPKNEINKRELIERAKQIEKQQMRKAFNSSSLTNMLDIYDSFEEFIETFKRKI